MIALRMLRQFGWLAPCALAISLIITPGLAADDSQEAWAALVKGGHVALIRHGNAPPGYGGDPPGFTIDDCQTQRNLDERGRAQARALGEAFRNHGVRVDRILSSPWCRCLDTAHLMAVGPVEKSWALVPDREPTAPVRLLELNRDAKFRFVGREKPDERGDVLPRFIPSPARDLRGAGLAGDGVARNLRRVARRSVLVDDVREHLLEHGVDGG